MKEQLDVEASVPDSRPELNTKRLRLRPFGLEDAQRMSILINDREIAANTRSIEFPYPDGAAAKWISHHVDLWLGGKSAIFAICNLATADLMGAIGLEIKEADQNAELGYWLGRPFWNQGFCTEAARAVVEFGLRDLGLHRIHAHFMTRNPASGRIMEKIGMRQEGYLRGHVRKWGAFEDIMVYGILASDLD